MANAGTRGTPGSQIFTGEGAPSDSLGSNNDFYLNELNGDYYKKAGGTWGSPLATLKGADGDPGPQGPAGADGLGVPPGGTTGQLLAKVSNADNDTTWINPPVATGGANQFALFDAGGELTSLAAYQYNPSRFNGLDWTVGAVPGAGTGYQNLHNIYASFNPTISNSQQNWRQFFIESAIGTDNSGNQMGDLTDGSLGTLGLSVVSRGPSSLGRVEVLGTFIDVGHDDPTPTAVTTNGLTLFNGQVRWRDNTIVNGIQLINFNFNSGTIDSVVNNYVNCFNFNGNIEEISGNGFTGSQFAVLIGSTQFFEAYKTSSTVDNVDNGVNIYAEFSQYGTIGQGYFCFTAQPTIDDCESFTGLNVNPTVNMCDYAYGVNANLDNVTVFAGVAATLTEQDLTFTCDVAGADGNNITIEYTAGGTAGSEVVSVVGLAISVQIEDTVSTAQQVKDAIDAFLPAAGIVNVTISGTAGDAQTVFGPTNLAGGVNPGFKRAGYFKGDVQIDGSLSFTGALSLGAVSAFSGYAIVNGTGNPASTHTLITNPTLGDNLTRTNADYLGVNTAMLLQVGDNSSISTAFLGVVALGFPAVVSLGASSTVDRIGGAVFAINLDGSSGAGSSIDIVSLARCIAIPNGITTVDRLYGYEFDLPFGDPGTDTWGLYFSAGTHNWLQGSLRLGGTPVSDDTTPHKLQVDGAALFDGDLGFFGVAPTGQQTGGAQTAGGTYTATEQDMIQKAYDCLRTFGLLD